jgi:hypothetical protein
VLFDGRNQADIEAVRSSTPTHYDGWSVGTSSSKENAREGTLDVNLTYGVEATIGFLATSFSMTTGVGGNWGSSQEWSSSLHYAGQVFDIPADDCPATTCPGYTLRRISTRRWPKRQTRPTNTWCKIIIAPKHCPEYCER